MRVRGYGGEVPLIQAGEAAECKIRGLPQARGVEVGRGRIERTFGGTPSSQSAPWHLQPPE